MIRRATHEDAAVIAEIERLSNASPWSEASTWATLALSATRAWVHGDPVDGHLVASVADGVGEIALVAVRPQARRQGIATKLIHEAQLGFRAEGVTEAHLEVRADNIAARALYESLGWRKNGVRARYYRDGADAVRYRWSP